MLTKDGKLVLYQRFKNLKILSINLNNSVNNEQGANFEFKPYIERGDEKET
jgi:hypothetical protein